MAASRPVTSTTVPRRRPAWHLGDANACGGRDARIGGSSQHLSRRNGRLDRPKLRKSFRQSDDRQRSAAPGRSVRRDRWSAVIKKRQGTISEAVLVGNDTTAHDMQQRFSGISVMADFVVMSSERIEIRSAIRCSRGERRRFAGDAVHVPTDALTAVRFVASG